MKRRHFTALLAAAVLSSGPVFATTIKDEFVAQLHKQGFKNLSITLTWLGRTRITGSNGKFQRELIFNSTSGEILRDYWKDVSPTAKKTKNEDAQILQPEDFPNSKKEGDSGGNMGGGDSGGNNGGGAGDGDGGSGHGGDGGSGHGGDGGSGHGG